jgi:proline iminopeptidase
MAKDAIEVTECASRRLGKTNVILTGQSWGAVLSVHVIERKPDLFAAFVGTGQPVSWQLTLEGRERWAREQATDAGDQVKNF